MMLKIEIATKQCPVSPIGFCLIQSDCVYQLISLVSKVTAWVHHKYLLISANIFLKINYN